MRFCLIIVILFINTCVLAQDLYRWQDEQGKWHFGDAASTNGQNRQIIEPAEYTTNVVKTKKLRLPSSKPTKVKIVKRVKSKKTESLEEKKLRCEAKREELRFQAFRYEQRNQYDRECVSEMKW